MIFRFVPYALIDAYLKLGWTGGQPAPGSHGVWSVVMKWLCDCEAKEPYP